MNVKYSIVIPAHNEKDNLPPLIQEIKSVMDKLGEPWEIIVVDDGSTDGSWEALHKCHLPQLRGFLLKQQSGQSAALDIGIKAALGEIIIVLDGDGQNDPHDIPKLLVALDGVDCVSGCRQIRQDRWDRKIISTIANGTRKWLLGDDIHDTGCSLKAYRADCLRHIKLFKGMHRFLPSLLIIEGFQVKELPVSHRPRTLGTSNYSIFNRGLSPIVDLLAVWWMGRRRLRGEIAQTLRTDGDQ